MKTICTGSEQNNWNLYAGSGEQLEIDTANTSFTVTEDALAQVIVQLGAEGTLLVSSSQILGVTIKVTQVDTGDQCFMPQKRMNVPSSARLACIVCDPFWIGSGSTIVVIAKSSDSGDIAVGGKVWIRDLAGDVKLASDGLDNISITAPSGVASDFREMLIQTWRRFFKKSTKSATEIKTFADNGSDVLTTQTITEAGDDETVGASS